MHRATAKRPLPERHLLLEILSAPSSRAYPSLGKPAVGKDIELPAFDELGVLLR